MPNYGKKFTALKKKVEAEKKRHQKKGARFGSCKCDELAEEAVYNQQMALNEGKMGKANAFGKLAFGWPWSKQKVDMTSGDFPEPSKFDKLYDEAKMIPGDGDDDEEEEEEWVPKFGNNPRLWEFQGPFYNKGYN